MKWPSRRISESSEKSFGMFGRAAQLAAQGRDIIHLEVGCPSFDTPLHIKEATKKALDDGIVHYGDFAGTLTLRQALADKVRSYNGIDATPDNILVTNGLSHAAYAALTAGVDEGDEVILLEPFYPQHINKIEMAGGRIVTAPLDAADNYRLRADWIEERVTAKTRMIVLVNPANPVGRVFTRDELEGLAEIAIRHDLMVISDEVYDQILFDEHHHISIAALPGMWERTISMFAFTKVYAMDGWRLGYAVCDARFMPALLKVTMNDVTHVNVFAQEGALAAITGPQDCLDEMHAEDTRRRELVCRRLNQMPGITCPWPEGTIYAFPDVSALGQPSAQLAEDILEATGVAVEAGSFYGAAGEGHLRICFGAEPYERLEEAMDRLSTFFNR